MYPHQSTQELVINWHLTEACNYSCRYCYAHWAKPAQQHDVIRHEKHTEQLLTELYQFFRPENLANPLRKKMGWSFVRLNIAGGEPLLYDKKLLHVMATARNLGMKVSIITNGSRLTNRLMQDVAPHLSLFGLSLDSMDQETNQQIGRVNKCGEFLELARVRSMLTTARQINPNMKLKINTVVNNLNCRENMGPIIHAFQPDRWKVLRMLPVLNSSLSVSQGQFDEFVNRHRPLGEVMCVEDHADMTDSYIMVDPNGRFFQNSPVSKGDAGYCYGDPILAVGAEAAFSSLRFSTDKFLSRYELSTEEVAA